MKEILKPFVLYSLLVTSGEYKKMTFIEMLKLRKLSNLYTSKLRIILINAKYNKHILESISIGDNNLKTRKNALMLKHLLKIDL